jgi:hypothetical protein
MLMEPPSAVPVSFGDDDYSNAGDVVLWSY